MIPEIITKNVVYLVCIIDSLPKAKRNLCDGDGVCVYMCTCVTPLKGQQRSTEVKVRNPCKHHISRSNSCLNFKLVTSIALDE